MPRRQHRSSYREPTGYDEESHEEFEEVDWGGTEEGPEETTFEEVHEGDRYDELPRPRPSRTHRRADGRPPTQRSRDMPRRRKPSQKERAAIKARSLARAREYSRAKGRKGPHYPDRGRGKALSYPRPIDKGHRMEAQFKKESYSRERTRPPPRRKRTYDRPDPRGYDGRQRPPPRRPVVVEEPRPRPREARRPPPKEERRPAPPGKTPFTSGTYVGLIGKVLYLIAIFLPWYIVMGSVDAGDYSTNGWVEIVRIDGMKGVQINQLLTGGAVPQPVSYLPVPLGWVLLFFFIWSIISIARARTARKRGWKFLRGGIVILIVFVVIYFIVMRLPTMLPDGSPEALKDLVGFIATAPLGGEASRTFDLYGSVDLVWGLELGGYMLFGSGVLQFVGAFMEWNSGKR